MIEIDEGQWPLIVLTFSGSVTVSELGDCFAKHERLLAAERPFVVLVRVHDMQPWESATIRLQATWRKENAPQLRRLIRGVAMVLPSLWLKGLLRTVLWVQPIPQPLVVCATTEEATAWLGERVRGLGAETVAEPPGV